jgi:dipeptidyl-peptidase 4
MKKLLTLGIILTFAIQFAYSQNRMLTMEEAILKANTTLAPENISSLGWIPNSNSFSYTAKKNGIDYLVVGKVNKPGRDTLLSAAYFKGLHNNMSDKRFPYITWLSTDSFYYTNEDKDRLVYEVYHVAAKKVTVANSIPGLAGNTEAENKKLNVAYTFKNNLYIATRTGNQVQVTRDKETGLDIVNGEAAHRREFGIEKGTFWSPNGNAIAFYHIDQSNVTNYPLVDISQRPAKDSLIKYPMAGMTSQNVTVGVYHISAGKLIYLKTGEPYEQYLTNITWSPDEKYIYISILNRGQNHLWLNKYDAQTGDFIKTLFEEKDDKYVEPLNPLMFLPKDNNHFLFLSQRDGYTHFYLYDTDGKLIRQVTKGNWIVTAFLGFDQAGKNVFYTSTAESPLDRQAYRTNLKTGKTKMISFREGYHSTQPNDACTYFIDRYSNQATPREINIIDADGGNTEHLLSASNPLVNYKMGQTKIFTIKSEDGKTDLYCRMIYPPDFNPSKKYPVVTYVYGGPHVQLIVNNWLGGSNLWMQLMAQKGYIVFTMDSRGSYNRGRDFEQATFRNLGTEELKDQVWGVNYLKTQPYVDTNRLGVHGWSFGGFMTTSLMTRYPGIYKVAVAGGPVIDWKYYEVMYTERYMDMPQENPDGYDKANLLNYVKNLKGKLMLIHGTVDDVVVWQHSLMFIKKCVDEGKPVDYFVYPGHPHNVLGPDRVHLMNKVTQYFEDYLK